MTVAVSSTMEHLHIYIMFLSCCTTEVTPDNLPCREFTWFWEVSRTNIIWNAGCIITTENHFTARHVTHFCHLQWSSKKHRQAIFHGGATTVISRVCSVEDKKKVFTTISIAICSINLLLRLLCIATDCFVRVSRSFTSKYNKEYCRPPCPLGCYVYAKVSGHIQDTIYIPK